MPGRASSGGGAPTPNREELLQMGIRAAKSGNTDGARIFFEQVLQQDERNERALMWMAQIAGSNKAERRRWLEKALEINPDNEQARAALKKIIYAKAANENRQLLMFGVIVGVMIVLVVVVLIALTLLSR